MFDYDVIVAGCGPAGLMAAAELQQKGINVLGIDRKPRLDENVRSASGFCMDDQDFNGENVKLEPLNGKTKIAYSKCGFSIEYSAFMEGRSGHQRRPTQELLHIGSRKKPTLPPAYILRALDCHTAEQIYPEPASSSKQASHTSINPRKY